MPTKETLKPVPEAPVQAKAVEASAVLPEAKKAEDSRDKAASEAQAVAKKEIEAVKGSVSIKQLQDEKGVLDIKKIKENAAYIPNELLYQIEDKRHGTLLELFATKTGDNTYEFNFQDNVMAQTRIGLSWFFKYNPEIRNVSVAYPEDNGGEVREGERKGLAGSFYDGGDYLEVLTGYKVKAAKGEFKKLLEKKEKVVAKFEEDKKDGRFEGLFKTLGDNKYNEYKEIYGSPEKIAYHVMEVSADNEIDPSLTMSLLQAENGDNGKFFGVMAEGCEGFEMQLEIAIRTIKTHEASYEELSNQKPYKDGSYTVEFLAYFSEIYSPLSAGNTNHFYNLYTNYFKYRGLAIPSDLAKKEADGKKLADAYRNGATNRKQVRNPVTEQQKQEILKYGVDLKKLVPDSSAILTSPYGMRTDPFDGHVRKFHTGIDIDGETGDSVNAWKDGTVTFGRRRGGYGKLVIIEHDDGSSESYYAHLDKINVKKGQIVHAGDKIGNMGNTGKSTGSHLHFEIRIGGQPVNPLERFNN